MDSPLTPTREKVLDRLVCGRCRKPLEFGKDDPVTDLLFRASRCTCLETDLGKANERANDENQSTAANQPAVSLSEAQTNLGDQYEVVSVLGSGGMGSVYKVRDKNLDKTFAVKILNQSLIQDQTSLRRFRQEALAAQSLTHANVGAVTRGRCLRCAIHRNGLP